MDTPGAHLRIPLFWYATETRIDQLVCSVSHSTNRLVTPFAYKLQR
jgi:hypothetical protein